MAGAGLGLTAAIGYRATPRVSFELEGQYQAYTSENAGTSQGLDTNVGVTLHARPTRAGLTRGCAWPPATGGLGSTTPSPGPSGLGTCSPRPSFSGWDVINARIGYDIRSSGAVAWAPVVGANLQTFVGANSTALSTVQWGTFIYAGLQARFDAGGTSRDTGMAKSGFSAE